MKVFADDQPAFPNITNISVQPQFASFEEAADLVLHAALIAAFNPSWCSMLWVIENLHATFQLLRDKSVTATYTVSIVGKH